MREYIHLKLITDAENRILQDIFSQLIKIDNNQYITTADSDGLKRFEQMLGIVNKTGETLESRRKKILNKWNDQDTYTYASFIKKLDVICGNGKYRLVEHFKDYMIELHTNLSAYGEVEELERIIDYMIPCNIQMNVANDLVWEVSAKAGMACGCTFIEVIEGSDYFKEIFDVGGSTYTSGANSSIVFIESSDNSNYKVEVHGSLNALNGLSEIVSISVSDTSSETLNISSNASLGVGASIVEVIANER